MLLGGCIAWLVAIFVDSATILRTEILPDRDIADALAPVEITLLFVFILCASVCVVRFAAASTPNVLWATEHSFILIFATSFVSLSVIFI